MRSQKFPTQSRVFPKFFRKSPIYGGFACIFKKKTDIFAIVI